MTMANPCPCELIVNESSSNNPSNSITDSTPNQFNDDEILEDYLDRLSDAFQSETSSDVSSLYPVLHQTKNFDANRKRSKRPSWAAVGKRATSLNSKRPSWAQVG
ncbi:unnamed protein product [Adineta steineri]|uniref:Uncharacterized protein n=1 Tax=Adineta steineri TaxID=433720 RepID=A0A815VIG7_9BILA|nr:unnamed protein product [Adineta steineri]